MDTSFYHNFPRARDGRSRDAMLGLGLDILRSLMRWGLLLVPETTMVAGVRLFQRRLCFTALTPSELAAHASAFGEFAIEYDTATFLGLGALPAFYLPNQAGAVEDLGDAGRRLVFGLHSIQHVLGKLKDSKDPIALEIADDLTRMKAPDLHNLFWVPDAAKNLFYPAGSDRRGASKPLAYYAQREWKIIENFPRADASGKAVWDFRKLTDEQKSDICRINSWFEEEVWSGCGFRRIDKCMLLDTMAGKKVVEMARRIIVPDEVLDKAGQIVGGRVSILALRSACKSAAGATV
jgi:hypothetical protein